MDESLDNIRWNISCNHKIYFESPLGEKICKRARFCQDLIQLYKDYGYPELLKLMYTYILQIEDLVNSIDDKKVKKITLKSLNDIKDGF